VYDTTLIQSNAVY